MNGSTVAVNIPGVSSTFQGVSELSRTLSRRPGDEALEDFFFNTAN